MIDISHILALSQQDFVRNQVRGVLSGRRFGLRSLGLTVIGRTAG